MTSLPSKYFLFFLVVSSVFLNPCLSRSQRQKRGVVKMMMHIMWDPVRLIRYWYAYDVTKEIAKSWRKIIPTMMVLPFNPEASKMPGIAKYVHPTHVLRETNRQHIHPIHYVPQYAESASAGGARPYSISDVPIAYQQLLRANFQTNDQISVQTGNKGDHSDVNWNDEKNIQLSENQSDDLSPGQYSQQMMVPLDTQNTDYIAYRHPTEFRKNENQAQHIVLKHPIAGTNSELTRLFSQAAQDSGREVHIVLHPVLMSDSQSKEPLSVSPSSTESSSENYSNLFIPNAPIDEQNSASSVKKCTTNCSQELSEDNSVSEENTSSEISQKVTWVLQPNSVNASFLDQIADSSNINSYSETQKRFGQKKKAGFSNQSLFNNLSIDMVKLKEALKHGTPVMVPFINKKSPNLNFNLNHSEKHEGTEKPKFSKLISSSEDDSHSKLTFTETKNSPHQIILFMTNKKPA